MHGGGHARTNLRVAAIVAAVWVSWLSAQAPDQPLPGGQEPGTEVEILPPEQERKECEGGYTTTACSVENEKFVRQFNVAAAVLVAASFAVAIPLLLASVGLSRMGWWRADYRQRWLRPTVIGFVLAATVFWLLPVLAHSGMVPAPVGLFSYPGVKPDFVAACAPCSSQVSNYPPLFGWFGSLGMPTMGLAIEQPWSLLLGLVIAFGVFSLVFFGVHIIWRRQRGYERLCHQGGGRR